MDTYIDKILYPRTYPLPSLPNLQRAAIIHVQEASGGVAGRHAGGVRRRALSDLASLSAVREGRCWIVLASKKPCITERIRLVIKRDQGKQIRWPYYP
jgi:hypothetical protein